MVRSRPVVDALAEGPSAMEVVPRLVGFEVGSSPERLT